MENQTLSPQESESEQREKMVRARKLLLIIGIVSIMMFFAGLASMHVVTKGSAEFWLQFQLPKAFIWSTVLIVLSSITMIMASSAIKKGKKGLLTGLLVISLLLGLGFVYSQFQGWGEMADKGMHLRGDFLQNLKGEYGKDYVIMTGPDQDMQVEYRDGHYYDPTDPSGNTMIDERISEYRNPAARNFIALTAVHALHVGGGILWLLYLVVMALFGKLSSDRPLPVTQGATYWHFVDILWVLLLLFLYFIH